MRVVVAGGTGFVGMRVTQAFFRDGHAVVSLSRRPPRRPVPGVEYVLADLAAGDAAGEAFAGVDLLVFAVSTTTPGSASVDPEYDRTSNVAAARAAAAAARQAGADHVLVISSGGTVYGQPDVLPVSEDAPLRPISAYGETRLAIETLFRQDAAFRTTVLRVGNALGEGQDTLRDQGAVGVFLGHLLAGEPIEIWGDGSVVRDYVYLGDVAAACLLAADGPGGVFNVGSGVGTSLLELLDQCARAVGREPEISWQPARSFDVPAIVLDVGRIGRELGWAPRVILEEGVRREAEWLRSSLPVRT